MPTIYDHINKEAGLIDRLPARSRVMNHSITVSYEGNLAGLIEFLEGTFKDTDCLTLKVEAVSNGKPITPTDKLVEQIIRHLATATHRYPEDFAQVRPRLVATLPDVLRLATTDKKIEAIKALREVGNVGLKDAKDVVEFIILPWVKAGGH